MMAATAASGFEFYDHTADLGLRAWAEDRAALIPVVTQSLYAAIGDVRTAAARSRPARLRFSGAQPAALIRDYLAHLIASFEVGDGVFRPRLVEVFTDRELDLVGDFAAIDEARSSLAREVKAVTYHDLRFHEAPGVAAIQLILDI